ncbi:hypothetical protein INT47_008882 [Mucor saturninus]|uniref:Uncharacterized protein n=1 Tax=Mucor saturninus TaxID=64648 RepID=A0A8H7R3B7_9FUNG|nr:hypothetical protein INT47_008882 [Mucor saturninus]
MKTLFHSKDDNPNYVVVSIALVQSELFWMCSVIFCLLRESKLLNERPKTSTARNRAYSESGTSSSHSKKSGHIKIDNCIILNEHDETSKLRRRLSLPNEVVKFRLRPSAEDELVGNTCPPLWWQKTRVKLGHAAVHGDSNYTKSASSTLRSSASISSIESLPISDLSSPCGASLRSSTVFTSVNDNNYTISLAPISTRKSIQSCSSADSALLNEKQSTKRKLMSKLNTALLSHYNRRKQPIDPKAI